MNLIIHRIKFYAQVALENYHFLDEESTLLLMQFFLDKLPIYVINMRHKHLK